ncbi:MAG TPA: ATP-binding protein, partial [Kofleriaceae bacterium]
MAEAIRQLDWSTTPLGPIESWPQSLKTATSIVLASKFAMVIAWGPEFVFLYNDRYRPILGTKPLALGKPAADIFPEVWDDIVGPLFRKATTEEAIAVDDLLIPLDRNGFLEECYFTLSYSPIRDESGGVGGLLAVVTETTERVQGERGLRTLRDLASCAAQAHSDEQAMRDAARVLVENQADVPFALCYLVEPDGIHARLVAAEGVEPTPAIAPARIAINRREPWPLVRGGGLELVGNLEDLPCPTAAVLAIERPGLEHPYGFVVLGTNPRRAIDEPHRTFFTLAADHIATAISNARAYEQERQRAEQLAVLDRAKTAFFSNISHEFRTPLTLMLGPTEDALASPEQCLRGEDLAAVHRNELRLLKLVNTLLDFSRIEAGRAEACFRPTDLARLTSDLASAFRSSVEKAGLTFEVDCPPLAEPIWVDDTMWEKIVLNLISNAFKFTFEGTIRVRLELTDSAAQLHVHDTGTGIPADELPRLFERFHRVQGAKSRTHEGSGIGLALVHELSRLHGGSVHIETTLGKGSTFTITIPRGTAHLPAERLGAERALASTALAPAAFIEEARHWLPSDDEVIEPTAQSLGRVLVVDDNVDMRDYLRRLLSAQFEVETAHDGVGALAAVAARRPDVIVSDVMMPNLDGFGLLRELRRDDQAPRIPVILLSARAGEESRIEGIQAGADDYVVKPFSARELVARVRTQISLAASAVDKARLYEEAQLARRDAEAAVRAKDEFFAILGHELRNPLTPIKTALHLMDCEPDAPFARERAIIERQVDHVVRLVDDLLDVSRITGGKVELRKQLLDLGHVLARTLENASSLFDKHDHEIITAMEPGLIVEADETRIAQVISNLVTNAAKYTPRGGRIEINAQRSGDEIALRVRDNGIGIDPAMLPHVFELFAQERQSLARSDGGLGLGLAIVRSMVQLHGGTVTVASAGRGLGAEFTVRLPAATRVATPRPYESTPLVVDASKLRVLVVDDNVDAAELLAESLRVMGHDTAVAFDGPEAIKIAGYFKPQIALLDIGLPAMDGYELARHLTDNANERPALLVAISGYGLEADRVKSKEAGFAEHLIKPV